MHDPNEDARPPTKHRTAIFILIAMFVGTAFLGWQVLHTSTLDITAVTKPGDYLLRGTAAKPTRLHVRVTGYLDGQATLEIPGQPAQTLGPETVDWKCNVGWTSPECLLKYKPQTVTLGRLTVQYRID